MERSQTVGKIVYDLQKNYTDEVPHTVAERIEQGKHTYQEILENAFYAGKTRFDSDFYIELCVKSEKILWNVNPRWLPALRYSCPTPMFNQSVFRYSKKDDYLEYLWTLPDIDACRYLTQNALMVDSNERELLNFVIEFNSGNLFKLMQKLNNETEETGQLLLGV